MITVRKSANGGLEFSSDMDRAIELDAKAATEARREVQAKIADASTDRLIALAVEHYHDYVVMALDNLECTSVEDERDLYAQRVRVDLFWEMLGADTMNEVVARVLGEYEARGVDVSMFER
jgi:hypothetical protein